MTRTTMTGAIGRQDTCRDMQRRGREWSRIGAQAAGPSASCRSQNRRRRGLRRRSAAVGNPEFAVLCGAQRPSGHTLGPHSAGRTTVEHERGFPRCLPGSHAIDLSGEPYARVANSISAPNPPLNFCKAIYRRREVVDAILALLPTACP